PRGRRGVPRPPRDHRAAGGGRLDLPALAAHERRADRGARAGRRAARPRARRAPARAASARPAHPDRPRGRAAQAPGRRGGGARAAAALARPPRRGLAAQEGPRVIVFGSAITDADAYRQFAEPGIELAREPDSVVLPLMATGSIFRSYNL